MQEEIHEVLNLIPYIISIGKKLIDGEKKLVVKSNLLHKFNSVLDIVENKPSDVIIHDADRKNIEIFEKILNKIPKLVVTQRSVHCHDNFIDIKRFKKLRHLELIRVPLDKVKGLNILKSQLEHFTCDHCGNVEMITKSGKLQWSELVTINLRSSPTNIDEFFFTSMPWILSLDLSFCNLKKLDALKSLDFIKILNLSYNHLVKLPVLSEGARSRLEILKISHNFLQDLEDLQFYTNLKGLDISWNWLADKRTLSGLLNLKLLEWINVSNNPLSLNKYYRLYVTAAIGSKVAPQQILIDNKPLCINERGIIGSGLGIVRCGKSLYTSDEPNPHVTRCLHSHISINTPIPGTSHVLAKSSSKVKTRLGPATRVREVVIQDLSDSAVEESTIVSTLDPTLKEEKNIIQETVEEPKKINVTSEVCVTSDVTEDSVSSEQIGKVKSPNDILETNENNQIPRSSITVGVVEVEVHDPWPGENTNETTLKQFEDKLEEYFKENNTSLTKSDGILHNLNSQQGKKSCISKDQKFFEEISVKTNDTNNSIISSNEKVNTDNSNEIPEKLIESDSSKAFPVNDTVVDSNELKTEDGLSSKQMVDDLIGIEGEFSKNLVNVDHSEEINSSTESHQDEQDYYSATEDKERTKTMSSIDSGELDQTASIESNQEGQTTVFLSATEENEDNNLSYTTTKEKLNNNVNILEKSTDSIKESEEVDRFHSDKNVEAERCKDDSMDVGHDSDSESSGVSDIEDDIWHVQKVDRNTNTIQSILLVLLENEIKERSRISGRTITRWPLDSVQSCVKTKTDPFTVELEFNAVKKEKQFRTYIMEFSDAQVLIKRMYDILESRPLSAMNQSTFKCLKCESIFVHMTPSLSKSSQVRCTVCSSLVVSIMDEPRPPEVKSPSGNKPISNSSSQSSIDRDKDGYGSSATSATFKSSCSAASLEQGQKSGPAATGVNTPRKYESDIEIISNPSQSSIEVIDESGRSQGSTPGRKKSSEERQVIAIPPQLGTVLEVNSQFPALTESSSSGSLSESVITTYESHNLINKKPKPEDCLVEESREGSPETELDINTSQDEENLCGNNWKLTSDDEILNTDIYSYNDFSQVDVRIKLFLYQTVFQDESEELLLLVKCHLWKTGGTDYDACIVFSTRKIYFFSHSQTRFEEETCDWLTLNDTHVLKDINKISPIIWNQGAIMKIKEITYLVLLMDKDRTINFLKFLEGLKMKELKIKTNINNNKTEMSLQQAVLSSNVSHEVIDPTVIIYAICLKISVTKDNDIEVLRLANIVITECEFHIVPGDLSWLCCANVQPSIHASQQIANLIEIKRGKTTVRLHFLNEEEALEENWLLQLATSDQVTEITKYTYHKLFN